MVKQISGSDFFGGEMEGEVPFPLIGLMRGREWAEERGYLEVFVKVQEG